MGTVQSERELGGKLVKPPVVPDVKLCERLSIFYRAEESRSG